MKNQININDRFGSWTILSNELTKKVKHGTVKYYSCKCDCGNVSNIPKNNLHKRKNKAVE